VTAQPTLKPLTPRLAMLYSYLAHAPDRGKALEDFCAEFFDAIPGVSVASRRVIDDAHSQEVDLVLENERHPDGFRNLAQILFVEAKNWNSRVGSAEVAWFDWKIRLSGYTQGFLVVSNGVTGSSEDKSSAWRILSQANIEGRRLIVLTPDEMIACSDPAAVLNLISSKLRRLAVHSAPL
jgi:Restriction endonuclease